jgi:hypothetical protein
VCCDLCDDYFLCEEEEHKRAFCCGRCGDQENCHGAAVSGGHMMGYEDDYDDLLDDTDDYDEDEDDKEEDEEDYDEDDYGDEGSSSIH